MLLSDPLELEFASLRGISGVKIFVLLFELLLILYRDLFDASFLRIGLRPKGVGCFSFLRLFCHDRSMLST